MPTRHFASLPELTTTILWTSLLDTIFRFSTDSDPPRPSHSTPDLPLPPPSRSRGPKPVISSTARLLGGEFAGKEYDEEGAVDGVTPGIQTFTLG